MSTTINNSSIPSATRQPNQRKLDRCQNGNLWAFYCYFDSAAVQWAIRNYYSTDNGANWTQDTNAVTWSAGIDNYGLNFSVFIDLDDYAHLVYKDPTDGFLYYRRGTPNAGRTAYTWSSASLIYADVNANYPDIITLRDPAGSGWKGVAVWSSASSQPRNMAMGCYVTITSGGVITVPGTNDFYLSNPSPGYGVNIQTFPSIDFQHTGDGKTAANSSPALFAAWSAGASGVGKGIRFAKATYSAGTWTWGTEREIDNTHYITVADYWINCVFDGTAVIIGGEPYSGSFSHLVLFERDVADTTTTTLYTTGGGSNEANRIERGTLTYDSQRNYYLIGLNAANTGLQYRKYVRASSTLAAPVALATLATNTEGYPSSKRGYSSSRIEWLYVDGASSPYSIKYDSLFLIINISLSRTYKWNVRVAVAPFTRIYKWNVLVTVSPFTRIYKWNVKQQVLLNRIYKWNVIQTIIVPRIYKWNVFQTISLSRIFKWNVRVSVPTFTRTFLWEVFGGWTRIPPQDDIWTEINENDAAWTPEPVNSTTWR
jgi:hypothetical protein